MPPTRPIEDALWSRVVIGPADECWPWTAAKNGGYGVFKHATKKRWADRAAWELANGPIPAGLKVLHECDNRPCCNPRHLRVGTQAENIADMVRKGRSADQSGEMNGNAKLTEAEVVAIRGALLDGAKQRDLAARFGVSKSLIGEIAAGRVWRGLGRAGPGGELVARIRSVHPDLCVSEPMSRISASAERTFIRLWTTCDDEGRCRADRRLLKAAIYPLHDEMGVEGVEKDVLELEHAGLICTYHGPDERFYLQVKSWSEYQHPQKPRASKLPPPPGHVPDEYGTGTGGVEEESHPGEGVGGESRGDGAKRRATPTPEHFTVDERLHEWLRAELPNVDYATETKKFLDHHRAKGSTMKDWRAAWRLWMRNSVRFNR